MANLKTKQQHVEWARVGGGPCEQRTCLLGICMNYIGVVDRSTSRASGCFCFGKLLERDNFVYWLCCQWSMWRLKLLTLNSTFTWLLVPLCSKQFFKQTASTKLRLTQVILFDEKRTRGTVDDFAKIKFISDCYCQNMKWTSYNTWSTYLL